MRNPNQVNVLYEEHCIFRKSYIVVRGNGDQVSNGPTAMGQMGIAMLFRPSVIAEAALDLGIFMGEKPS